MKITISYIFFMVLIILYANTVSATNTPKRYPKSKSGIIKYEIYGATITGSEVVYYDDWGSPGGKIYNNNHGVRRGIGDKKHLSSS